MANIYDLPAEILLQIFRFYLESEGQRALLRRVAPVCSYWEKVCMNSGALWTKYDGTLTYKDLIGLCEKGHLSNTKELVISKTNLLNDVDAQSLFANAKNVEIIDFSQVFRIEKGTFNIIASNCSKLRGIQIGKLKCRLNYSILEDLFVLRGKGLTAINLSLSTIPNMMHFLRSVADCCTNLEELHLMDIACANSTSFPTKYFQERCPKLKILHLDQNITVSNDKHEFGFPNLEVFTYFDRRGYSITDRNFECIVFNSPNLKFLNLTNCRISPEVLCTIPASSVEYLYIARCKMLTSKNLNDVFQKWSHSLKQLDISHSNNSIINKAIQTLVSHPTESHLEVLNLNFTVVLASVVTKVIQVCHRLKVLHLEGCRSLERGMKKTYTGESELEILSKKLEAFISANPSVNDPIKLH